MLAALLLSLPGTATAAEVRQVRNGLLLQLGDGNRSYGVELACVAVDAEHNAAATDWLRDALPRGTKVNIRPMGTRDGLLLARVSPLNAVTNPGEAPAQGNDLSSGLIEAGLAEPLACDE